MPATIGTLAGLTACGAAIGLGVAGGALVGANALVLAGLQMVGSELAGEILGKTIARVGGSLSESSTQIGRNHDIVRLLADAASHCVQEVAEKRRLTQPLTLGERRRLEGAAARLKRQWLAVDAASLGAACRSPEVVDWFKSAGGGRQAERSPLTLEQWHGLVGAACARGLSEELRAEVASALHERFTHWVRQRFKDDFSGNTPAKGRAYATLQMSLLGGLYDLLGATLSSSSRAADAADHIKIDTEQIRAELDAIGARIEILAKEPALAGRLDTLLGETRLSRERVLEQIRSAHEPLLTLPTPDPGDEAQRFVFRNERIALVGRDHELAELDAWLDQARPFSWDLWTGPAGVGKSRLALHLCHQREQQGWRAGFYDWQPHALVRFDLWTPATDVLMVFDYASERAGRIGEILRVLCARQWSGGRRVRALLLEREIVREPDGDGSDAGTGHASDTTLPAPTPPWLEALLAEGSRAGAAFRGSHARQDLHRPDRKLGGVAEGALAEIVRQDADLVGASLDEPEVLRRVRVIRRVDPRARPLFAAMTAEALRETDGSDGGEPAGWDAGQLVTHVLRRERRRWAAAFERRGLGSEPELTRWERLACLATMCGGLSGSRLRDALRLGAKVGLPGAEAWGDGGVYRLLVPGSGMEARAIEPDVVGEAFVLWRLGQDKMLAGTLVAIAWESGMEAFVVRAAADFASHPLLDELLEPVAPSDDETLSLAHKVRLDRLREQEGPARAAALGRALAESDTYPPIVRAVGLGAWANHEWAEAECLRFCEICREQWNAASDDPRVHRHIAGALYTVSGLDEAQTAWFLRSREPERIDGLVLVPAALDALRELSRHTPENTHVQEFVALSMVALLMLDRPPLADSHATLAELQRLAAASGDSEVIVRSLALGIFADVANHIGDEPRAVERIKSLRLLAREHPDDSQVVSWLLATVDGLFRSEYGSIGFRVSLTQMTIELLRKGVARAGDVQPMIDHGVRLTRGKAGPRWAPLRAALKLLNREYSARRQGDRPSKLPPGAAGDGNW